MRIKKILPNFIIRSFKKTNIDNFIGGLFIGAIFSLLVNIATVKVQDTIDRQRALEAVERELTYHLLDVSTIFNEEKRVREASPAANINIDGVMAKRFSTKVWDNTEIYKYLLEVDPTTAAEVEMHYETIIKGINRMFDENNKYYNQLYEPCRPFYAIFTKEKQQTQEYCRFISVGSIETQSDIAYGVFKSLSEVKKTFHPTKDRLQNPWLRFLLGSKSVRILE